MRNREELGRSRIAARVAILAAVLPLVFLGEATAALVTYDLDAYISEINGDTSQAITAMDAGSFTTDTNDGLIDSFTWDAIGPFGAFTTDDLGSSFATFDTNGDLSGLYVSANNGSEILSLYVGTSSGGPLEIQLSITGATVALGSYAIRDESGDLALGGGGGGTLVPEPSSTLLFGVGLMIAGTATRRRKSRR